jgi:ectoine hydroxylase
MTLTFDVNNLAKQFWQQGYLHVSGFFGMDPSFLHSEDFIKQSGAEVIPWFPEQDNETCFSELNADPRLIALTEQILGKGWYEQYCMVMFSKHDTAGQAWHQDCLCDTPEHFNLNRLMYTMDISENTTGGQTTVVPASHLAGIIPSLSQHFDQSNAITLSPKKGDLLLLHGHCYHKVEKVTGQYRVSANYRAASTQTPKDITDIGVYRNMIYQFSTSTLIQAR